MRIDAQTMFRCENTSKSPLRVGSQIVQPGEKIDVCFEQITPGAFGVAQNRGLAIECLFNDGECFRIHPTTPYGSSLTGELSSQDGERSTAPASQPSQEPNVSQVVISPMSEPAELGKLADDMDDNPFDKPAKTEEPTGNDASASAGEPGPDDALVEEAKRELTGKKMGELRDMLSERNLSTDGSKAELVDRLAPEFAKEMIQ